MAPNGASDATGTISPVRLVIRSAANAAIGAGHAMRCAALAEGWVAEQRGETVFEGEYAIDFVQARLASLRGESRSGAPRAPARAILVCDSYDSEVRAQCAARREFALRVLVDDIGVDVPAGYDVVWNPNAYEPPAYATFAGRVLGGPRHVAIRSGLPSWNPTAARGITVMLGGGAPPAMLVDAVGLLCESLASSLVVAGAWRPDGVEALSRRDPWERIARSTCLVTSAGSTIWEAAAVGVPVVAIRTAVNQALVTEWVRTSGAPVIDALAPAARASTTLSQLVAAIAGAKALPPLRSGIPALCRELLAMLQAGAPVMPVRAP